MGCTSSSNRAIDSSDLPAAKSASEGAPASIHLRMISICASVSVSLKAAGGMVRLATCWYNTLFSGEPFVTTGPSSLPFSVAAALRKSRPASVRMEVPPWQLMQLVVKMGRISRSKRGAWAEAASTEKQIPMIVPGNFDTGAPLLGTQIPLRVSDDAGERSSGFDRNLCYCTP